MMNWTFSRKLGAAFAVVVILAATLGGIAYATLDDVVHKKDQVLTINVMNLIDAERLRASAFEKTVHLRGYLLGNNETALQQATVARTKFANLAARMRERGLAEDTEQLVDAIEVAEESHQDALNDVISARKAGRPIEVLVDTFNVKAAPRFLDLDRHIDALVDTETRHFNERSGAASRRAESGVVLILAITAGLTILAGFVGVYLTRSLARQIGSAVQHVRNSSSELKTSAAQQASGIKEQATAMTQIATTVSELLASTRQIAETAQRVAGLAREAEQSATMGSEIVSAATTSIDGIRREVDTIVQHMLGLGKRSQQVGAILEIINELAEQTNILAINATIEAAGAGDAGRRFAVVGDEIRKLADRVGGSTKEIRELIEQIRSAVNVTVMATESGAKTVESGTRRFHELNVAFQRIGAGVETATQAAREIELSTQQQTTAVEQVNIGVANVAQASRETEAASSQTAQTAAQLLKLSDELIRLVRTRSAS